MLETTRHDEEGGESLSRSGIFISHLFCKRRIIVHDYNLKNAIERDTLPLYSWCRLALCVAYYTPDVLHHLFRHYHDVHKQLQGKETHQVCLLSAEWDLGLIPRDKFPHLFSSLDFPFIISTCNIFESDKCVRCEARKSNSFRAAKFVSQAWIK